MSYFLSQPRIEEPIYLGPSDISLLRARISEAESQVESLKNELKRVYDDDAQISELTRRKDEQLVEIAFLRNILSPVRRMPQELLSEIFELSCVPEDGWKSSYNIIHRTSVLCRVCIAWTRTAHSTPRLWSKFCHDTRHYRIREEPGEFEWVREWISRSQSQPLDVYLSVFAQFDDDEALETTEILEHVFSFRHRIRLLDLNIQAKYRSHLPIFQSLPQSSFPLLEKITLSYYHPSQLRYTPDKIYMLIGSPNLRHVNMAITYPLRGMSDLFLLPVEQLESLEIYDPLDYKDWLIRCNELVHLDVRFKDYRGLYTQHFFLLPALKSLKVSCHKPSGHGAGLLSCLTVPLLEELTLYRQNEFFCRPFADLAGFQRRSATTLSSLTLQNFGANDGQFFAEELTAVLPLFPGIKYLHMVSFRLDIDPLLQTLTYTRDRHNLLPNLTTLTLHPKLRDDTIIYPKELTAMILSRWWPDADDSEPNHGDDIDSQLAFDLSGLQRLQTVSLRGYCNVSTEIASVSGLTGLDVEFCD